MATSKKSYLLHAAEQLKSFLQRPENRGKPLERAFISWYIEARYGKEHAKRVVDGCRDRGIDAIVKEGEVTVILQSKYETSPRVSAVSGKELSDFEEVAQVLTNPKGDEQFKHWLTKVRKPLQAHYRRIRKKALTHPETVRFDFITTKRLIVSVSEPLNIVDIERVAHLWFLFQEGFTPTIESIKVDFLDVWGTGLSSSDYRTYVGRADVRSLIRLMDKDENERLFAQNVRTDLRSRVNGEILKSYIDNPDTFWLGNNGIYIVCGGAKLDGKTLELNYPSVINGSQTLHSIYSHGGPWHGCEILIRVLVMDIKGERDLLKKIIQRANNQNPMKAMNLAAHNHEQLVIAQYLDRFSIFYERREKEWRNEKKLLMDEYISVSLKEIAQWLAVTGTKPLIGSARSSPGILFQDKNVYKKLFGKYEKGVSPQSLNHLARAVWAGIFVKRLVRRIPPNLKSQAMIVHLLLVRTVFEGLSSTHRNTIDSGLKLHSFNEPSLRTIRLAKRVVRLCVKQQRALQRRKEKLDLSNVFKRNDLTASIYRKTVNRSLKGQFQRALNPIVGGG